MRSCIYCGRELEKGEVCNCPQSYAYRQRKESAAGSANAENSGNTASSETKNEKTKRSKPKNSKVNKKDKKKEQKATYSNPYRTETSYKTGYAGNDSFFERKKTKARTRKAARSNGVGINSGFKGFWRYILDVLKSPIEKVANPGHLSKAAILAIAAIQGALFWLCVFFVMHGSVGPLRFLANLMSFNGSEGYRVLLSMGAAVLSGALSGVILFFLYSGIFYVINRFLMRLNTPYWEFCVRLITSWVPFAVICAVGVVLSMLAPMTLFVLLLCGAASTAVLTYEALKTEWISRSPGKVMYAMILGYFVFCVIVTHLLLI
jgi:hypothetical protein